MEVRVRMPMRHLGGRLVGPGSRTRAPVVLLPTIRNVVALAPDLDRFRRQGQRVIVDSDGDLLNGDGHPILVTTPDPLMGVFTGMTVPASADAVERWRAAYREMVLEADAVTVSTPYLAGVYRAAGARRVFVCPNAVDPEQWPEAPWRDRDDPFAVGFAGAPRFAGAPGRDELDLIRPALEWAAGRRRVETVVFGGFDVERAPGGLLPSKRPDLPSAWQRFSFEHIPFTDCYETYRERLSGLLDVALMPLAAAAHNRGRSDLKVCELAMAGTLPIVSDAPNYEAWRDTPVLFARDQDEFVEHVKWAVSHRDQVRERAIALREIVLRERAMPAAVEPWRQALAKLTTSTDVEGQRDNGSGLLA